MSERYSKLFALSENLYAAGAPVVIAAGALLKDNQTGNVLAQLKFKSISNSKVKAITVRITVSDTAGRAIGEPVEHQYLDLGLKRDGETGQKEPVALPDATIRAFVPEVTEVVFDDSSVWTATGEAWEPLPPLVTLDSYLNDFTLSRQYKIQFGERYSYAPEEHRDLWYCACGAVNHSAEQRKCHICGKSFQELRDALDPAALNAAAEEHIAKETQEKEEQAAAEREAAAIRAKKIKKRIAIVTPILCAVIAIAVVTKFVIIPAVNNSNAYKAAESLLAAEDYDGAISAFSALGDYKDSAERVTEVEEAKLVAAYADAEARLDTKDYDGAISAFSALGDYKDSATRIVEVSEDKNLNNYNSAIDLMESKNYAEAISIFEGLGDYKDADAQLLSAYYTYAVELYADENYTEAYSYMAECGEYMDAIEATKFLDGLRCFVEEDYAAAYNKIRTIEEDFVENAEWLEADVYEDWLYICTVNYVSSAEKLSLASALSYYNQIPDEFLEKYPDLKEMIEGVVDMGTRLQACQGKYIQYNEMSHSLSDDYLDISYDVMYGNFKANVEYKELSWGFTEYGDVYASTNPDYIFTIEVSGIDTFRVGGLSGHKVVADEPMTYTINVNETTAIITSSGWEPSTYYMCYKE